MIGQKRKSFKLPSGVSWIDVWEALKREYWDNPKRLKIPNRVCAATIALLTGRRLGEISMLRWEHINWKEGVIKRKILKKKREWHVEIPFGNMLEKVLRRIWYQKGRPREGRVVDGHPKGWSLLFHKWARRKGRNIRFHDLRHLYALDALARGVPLPALQRLLQHNDLKTTAIYLEMNLRDLADYVL